MFKGIRGQLFFGFGALVVVINLFYFRMTVLFVDVTESWVSHYILSSEAALITSPNHNASEVELSRPEQFLKNDISILRSEDVAEMGILIPSIFDENLYSFEYKEAKGFAFYVPLTSPLTVNGQLTPVHNVYVTLNTQNTAVLSYFSSVFGVFLFSAAIGVILLTVLSTWFIAAKLAAPIISLTNKVASQEVDAKCHIDEAERQDEIGRLAQTFEKTFLALQQAWRREHDFANDVSHELRTPIALIQNTLVLNESQSEDNASMSEEDRQLISMSAHTLHNTVEVLLSLARKENLVFEPISLLPIIERTILALYGANIAHHFDVDVNVKPNTTGIGNAHLITLLFQNLINNGFYHGGQRSDSEDQQRMRIFSNEAGIVFENDIADVRSSNYQGLGHGQYLVQRIAQVMGWRIAIHHTANHYSVTVFPLGE